MQKHEHLLCQIFGDIPRQMRCREHDNPFTKLGEDLFALHGIRPI